MNKLLTAIAICLLVGINYSKAQIAWPQNGSSIYYNGGNVGIGTTSPAYKLEINGAFRASGISYLADQSRVIGTGTGADWTSKFRFDDNAGNPFGGIGKYNATINDMYIYAYGGNGIRLAPNTNTAMYLSPSGNVGIGTVEPQSQVKLDVRQSLSNGYAIAGYVYDGTGSTTTATKGVGYATSGEGIITGIEGNSQGTRATGTNIGGYFWASGAANNYALITGNGKVGIGTTSPAAKFVVLSGVSNNEIARFGGTLSDRGLRLSSFVVNGTNEVGYDLNAPGAGGGAAISFSTLSAERMRINYNGNVGIGITNPQYKLAVEGTIAAREVKVTAEAWADFVFHPNYKLRTLGEVEQFIKTNNHLPEIPTETEVKENGVSLGEMNAKLLQKIEELTLYVIEQQKQINDIKEQNLKLSKDIETIKR